MSVSPRPYQVEQFQNTIALHAQGIRSVMFEAATGSGKTTSAGMIVEHYVRLGKTVLFLAHRGELLTQARDRFVDHFGLRVGIEQGSKYAGDEPVVCASVQTMRGARLENFPRDAFDILVIDECHHAPSPSYQAIIRYFSQALVVGVTATVDRADGVALGTVFQAVAHRYGIEKAIGEGFLVPVRGVQVMVPGMDLSAVRQRRQMVRGSHERPGETIDLLAPAGQARLSPLPNGVVKKYSVDLHPTDLGKAMASDAAVEGIVIPTLELAGTRRTIIFAVDINHAMLIVESINAKRPGAARVVHGDTKRISKKERAEIQRAHQAGEFQFMVNCALLVEGYDDPAIGCVVMARPTMSRVFYCQAVGRALRLFAGKTEALLLDFVGVGCKFNLVGPEDALGKALVGPVTTIGAIPKLVAKQTAKARLNPAPPAPAKRDLGDWFADLLKPAPAAPAKPQRPYSTKAVDLIWKQVKKVGGWFARLFDN